VREEDLTLQILDMLRAHGLPAWRTHDTRHHPVEEGISDINAVLPGGVIFVCEVKKPGGSTNRLHESKQADWLRRVADQGGAVCKVTSLEGAREALEMALASCAQNVSGRGNSVTRTSWGG
jgi:hypothetical protein